MHRRENLSRVVDDPPPPEYDGGTIFVDGKAFGSVGGAPGFEMNLAVPTGKHEIRVQKRNLPDLIGRVEYANDVHEQELIFRANPNRQ